MPAFHHLRPRNPEPDGHTPLTGEGIKALGNHRQIGRFTPRELGNRRPQADLLGEGEI